MKPIHAILLLLTLATACRHSVRDGAVPTYHDVGAIHKTITTDSAEAQTWFDRGLGLAYGFNHEEAVACFERALDEDPDCAMCRWGIAYALGPNYNNTVMEEAASRTAHAMIGEAVARADRVGPLERDLIGALSARYAWPAPEDRTELEAAYADAMREVHGRHPEDPDVAALTGEAVMMLRPWQLWSPEGEAAPETPEIREILEGALARHPDHPALCHLYIHTMEAGPEPEAALPAAHALERRGAGLGHLIHMPSHIYVWTGRYDDVIRTNVRAVEADRAFVEHAGRENFYTLYRLHNYHFVAYGAMWDGRREQALAASRELVEEIPAALLEKLPDLLDVFVGTPYHVLVRFGMWEEILAEPEPTGELHAARAIWRYARGIALASLGRVTEARAEREAFLAAKEAVPDSRLLFNNPVAEILEVASEVLAGELAYREGRHEKAFEHLRRAVVLDELLNYDEPWGWMEPARHALGALLNDRGRYEEAVGVYEANLARYPENGWALRGLAEALDGLGRHVEANRVARRFEAAWDDADLEIPGSCFCRTPPAG